MDFWMPPEIWKDNAAYIIGGGPSLKNMDWTPFKDKRVIGCNDAYTLGDWIDVCFFGDYLWYMGQSNFVGHREKLMSFPGLKVTCSEKRISDAGILRVRRAIFKRGITFDRAKGTVCWNGNTGLAAINLAIYFGCKKIVLLGFDMKLSNEGDSNWHPNLKTKPNKSLYPRYLGSAQLVAKDIKAKFPDIEVLNANPGSAMEYFKKVEIKDVVQ